MPKHPAPERATDTSTIVGPDRMRAVSRRAYLVWGGALFAYVIAVLNRTSFGVVGVQAAARFDIGAGMLSTFVVVQVAVYAFMQVPAGLLLDRFGARRLITVGAVLMAIGQLTLALVPSIAWAIVARVLVGAGDALTFIAVLRLVALWFPARRAPLFTQLSGMVGQGGQILSAVPFVAFMGAYQWTAAFVGLAAVGVFAAIVAYATIRDQPATAASAPASSGPTPPVRAAILAAWREPGTRLGFFTHLLAQFSLNVFVLMWGFTFLVTAENVPESTASALLVLNVIASAVFGPTIGELVARHPARRSAFVIVIAVSMLGGWLLVLVPAGPVPVWVLTVFVVLLALGGPGSMIGFDFARTTNPPERLGTATGIVNAGGFVSALVGILVVGVVLDAFGASSPGVYPLDAYRCAFGVLGIIWLIGMAGVLASRNALRRRMAETGAGIRPPRRGIAERVDNGRES